MERGLCNSGTGRLGTGLSSSSASGMMLLTGVTMIDLPAALQDYIEGLKAHDVARIADVVSPQLSFVGATQILRKDAFLQMLESLYAGFPDWHYDHDPPETMGEVIAIRWRQGGTHTGTFAYPGIDPVVPTNRKVEIPEHFFFYEITDDKISVIRPERVPGGAPAGILQQIGVESPPL
jgi:predicted ester cyclase